MTWIKENWFRLGIILAILLLAHSVYFSLVVVPDRRVQSERQKFISEEISKKANKDALDSCLIDADIQYSLNWASACESNAKIVEDGYKNCRAGASALGASDCRTIWGVSDASPTCTLPYGRAENVNKYHEQAKDDCYRRYPIK